MWTTFIGFTGSGKSTLSTHLQHATGRAAVDLDAVVETRDGRPLAEIIAVRGEDALRRREATALVDLPADGDLIVVVSSGGVELPANVALLRDRGIVFWLDASWQAIRERLGHGYLDDRPWLGELGWDRLARLHRRRRRLFAAAADFRLRTDRQPLEVIGRKVLLKSLLWRRRQEDGLL
jgi:shikimate kinase